MKKAFLTFAFCCLGCVYGYAQQAQAKDPAVDDRLSLLYNNGDYFQLLRYYQQNKERVVKPFLSGLVEGTLDLFLNKRTEADESLKKLINDYSGSVNITETMHLAMTMTTNLLDMGRYGEAYERLNSLMGQLDAAGFPPEIMEQIKGLPDYAGLLNNLAIAEGLKAYPAKETVFPAAKVEVPLTFRPKEEGGHMSVEGHVNGHPMTFTLDTGFGGNLFLSQKVADALGVRTVSAVQMAGAIGTESGQLGIVDSFEIGGIVVRNVLVMVLDDGQQGLLDLEDMKTATQAIIGWKLMESLGEIEFYPKEGKVAFSESRKDGAMDAGTHIMLVNGKIPFFELWCGEEWLLFQFDTGATVSSMSDLYYEKHKNRINETLPGHLLRMGGVGGARTFYAFSLPSFPLRLGRTEFEMKNIDIVAEHETYGADGVIGADFMQMFDRVRLDFGKMYIEVEK